MEGLFWNCFSYSMAFEVALLVAFKTTRNGFRKILPQTEDRGKFGSGLGSQFILALGFGVLNKLAAADAAKTRGSAISEGRSPRERRHREAKRRDKKNTRPRLVDLSVFSLPALCPYHRLVAVSA